MESRLLIVTFIRYFSSIATVGLSGKQRKRVGASVERKSYRRGGTRSTEVDPHMVGRSESRSYLLHRADTVLMRSTRALRPLIAPTKMH